MFESNTIVVVIDPEIDNRAVVEKAIAMALVSHAELEIVYSEYVHYLEDGYFYDPVVAKSLREEHSKVNKNKSRRARPASARCRLKCQRGCSLGKPCTQVAGRAHRCYPAVSRYKEHLAPQSPRAHFSFE